MHYLYTYLHTNDLVEGSKHAVFKLDAHHVRRDYVLGKFAIWRHSINTTRLYTDEHLPPLHAFLRRTIRLENRLFSGENERQCTRKGFGFRPPDYSPQPYGNQRHRIINKRKFITAVRAAVANANEPKMISL